MVPIFNGKKAAPGFEAKRAAPAPSTEATAAQPFLTASPSNAADAPFLTAAVAASSSPATSTASAGDGSLISSALPDQTSDWPQVDIEDHIKDGEKENSPVDDPREKKTKKPRAKKDPNAPKRPISSYMHFCSQVVKDHIAVCETLRPNISIIRCCYRRGRL